MSRILFTILGYNIKFLDFLPSIYVFRFQCSFYVSLFSKPVSVLALSLNKSQEASKAYILHRSKMLFLLKLVI